MKLRPLHDWTVIIPAQAEVRTAGGLYIPDTAKEKPEEGVVEAIGPGAYEEEKHGKKKEEGRERKFIPTTVKPGDRVLYERWAGKTQTIGTEERVIVRERDILGWIERPLIPASTTARESTSILPRPGDFLMQKPAVKVKSSSVGSKPKKAAKPAKKSAKKPAVKKAAKKAANKAAPKKSAAKKAGKAKKKK